MTWDCLSSSWLGGGRGEVGHPNRLCGATASIHTGATRRGIPVTNVPAYCLDEVAEHTLALLLACARKVCRYDSAVRAGNWGLDTGMPMYRVRGRTLGKGNEPFLNVHGAGYRGVYDFADPDSSVFVTSTGQSGHFLSRHYDDLGELWRRGEYIPMSLDENLARAAAVGVTVLQPR